MSKRRRSSGTRKAAEARFWGAAPEDGGAAVPDGERLIRPSVDPGALVRSLGPPPLAVDSTLAERHLTAVYEEAVRAATALAAASGLLAADPDEG